MKTYLAECITFLRRSTFVRRGYTPHMPPLTAAEANLRFIFALYASLP